MKYTFNMFIVFLFASTLASLTCASEQRDSKMMDVDEIRTLAAFQEQSESEPQLALITSNPEQAPQEQPKQEQITSTQQGFLQLVTSYLLSMPTQTKGAALNGYLTTGNACNITVKVAAVAAIVYGTYHFFFRKKDEKNPQNQSAPIKFC